MLFLIFVIAISHISMGVFSINFTLSLKYDHTQYIKQLKRSIRQTSTTLKNTWAIERSFDERSDQITSLRQTSFNIVRSQFNSTVNLITNVGWPFVVSLRAQRLCSLSVALYA